MYQHSIYGFIPTDDKAKARRNMVKRSTYYATLDKINRCGCKPFPKATPTPAASTSPPPVTPSPTTQSASTSPPPVTPSPTTPAVTASR